MLKSSRTIFTGHVKLNVERVVLPNGKETELEIIHHPGGIAIVVIDAEGRVCLLRQFRHAAGEWIWEIPAGTIEPSEERLNSAKRELLEEAGVTASTWHELGKTISSPGVFTEIIYLFSASDITFGQTEHEAEECIEIHWFTMDEIRNMIVKGEIYDAKTVVGIHLFSLKNK